MKFTILVLTLGLLSGCATGTRHDAASGALACPPAYNGCFAD